MICLLYLNPVNNYLDPDGIFIFDMNTLYKYWKCLEIRLLQRESGRGEALSGENEFDDEETGINVMYDLTLFLPREDGLYERDGKFTTRRPMIRRK